MKKIHLSLAGMIVSLLIALCGLLVLTGALGGETYSMNSSPVGYDSGYAMFGADYYNYVCNNTAETAAASYAAVQNIRGISELLTNVCGIFLLGLGLMGLCAFGLVFLGQKGPRPAAEVSSASDQAPAAGTEEAPGADRAAAPPQEAPAEAPAAPDEEPSVPADGAAAPMDPRVDPMAPMR